MANRLGRRATHELTRIGLVLSHRRARRDWFGRAALLLFGVLAGVAGGYATWGQPLGQLREQAALVQDQKQLQQQVEQSQQALRVSESRGQELERQIASLVQQVRESHEELTFFRKARDGSNH
jgi:septal ring factor EnvC (AmiA/AmiB activator)